jgi:hypothetical protein
VGEKVRVVASWCYKFCYSGRDTNRNRIKIIINHKFINDMAEVQRKNDRILNIYIMIGGEIAIVINI